MGIRPSATGVAIQVKLLASVFTLVCLTACARKPANPEAEEAALAWKLLREREEAVRYYHPNHEPTRELSR